MPKKDNKTLKYNHGKKSMKVPFIIYTDLDSLLEKMNTCHNNPKKTLTTKENKINRKQKLCYICKKGFSTDDDTLNVLKLKELKPKETKPIEYYNYFINGRAEIRCGKRFIRFRPCKARTYIL